MEVNLKTSIHFTYALAHKWVGQGPKHAKENHEVFLAGFNHRLWWDCSPFKEGLARLRFLGAARTPADDPPEPLTSWRGV